METTNFRNTATFIHLSALSQYLIPFGNFIFPIIIWTNYKNKSEFVDYHGKQVLNFQLSLFLYSFILTVITISIFAFAIFNNISLNAIINNRDFVIQNFNFSDNIESLTIGFLVLFILGLLKISEFFLIIFASIKASNGEMYHYPMSFNFIK